MSLVGSMCVPTFSSRPVMNSTPQTNDHMITREPWLGHHIIQRGILKLTTIYVSM